MKRLTIFLTIFITLSMGLIAFFAVKPNAQENQINENTVIENEPRSVKLYFSDYADRPWDAANEEYYFDFTSLPSFYDYFIIYFPASYSLNIVPTAVTGVTYEVYTREGFQITSRTWLHWEIVMPESFNNTDYFVLATNLEYILNLDNNIYYEYINGYDIGYDNGYGEGYGEGYNYGHGVGYVDGEDIGYNNGYNDGYDDGIVDTYHDGFEGFAQFPQFKDKDSYSYHIGFAAGIDASNDYSFAGLLGQVFIGLGSLLAINLLPNISLGAIIAVPVVFGIIAFILGKRGGKGD